MVDRPHGRARDCASVDADVDIGTCDADPAARSIARLGDMAADKKKPRRVEDLSGFI
jgi:hypothetical protein